MTATTRKKSNTRTRAASASESGERESTKPFRAARQTLPPLKRSSDPATNPEIELRVYALVMRVEKEEGMAYPPEWSAVADAAKRLNYVRETGLRLYLTKHGAQWLDERANASKGGRGLTMTKLTPRALLELKDLSRDTGVLMQDAISEIISAVHDNRHELTAHARKHGFSTPWHAIAKLVREK